MSKRTAVSDKASTGFRALRIVSISVVACLGLAALLAGIPDAQSANAQESYSHTGVASCAGSTCHGRTEGNGAIVRQDEISIWQDPSAVSGAHSRAYTDLAGPRGQQIAESLGWDNATSRSECLGCHSTFTSARERGPRFQLSDGVGCESCHGGAGDWIASHYRVGGTHPANVSAGLTPLENPQTRARVCLDCHYGSADEGQFVTHAMMAAGHPRITFELDLFSSFQQHHNADDDYLQRKGGTDNVQLWAVGQAEAVTRATDLYARPDLATEGVFPEFYFYDCHSCHRAITDGPNRRLTFETNPSRPIPFGQPPFNDENILMLSTIAQTLAPAHADAFRSASRNFHDSMDQGRPQAQHAAMALRAEAAELSDALAAGNYGGNSAFAVIAAIGGDATRPSFTDYAGSTQAVMAIDTLLNSLVTQNRITMGAAAGIRRDIARAYQAVRSPETYQPAQFRSALSNAVTAIGRLR